MLTGKQKRYLRGLGNRLKSTIIVGKDGLTYNILNSLNNDLKAHELVKVNILKTCDVSANEIAIEMAAFSSCEIVQIIGRVVLLYKRSKKHLIELP